MGTQEEAKTQEQKTRINKSNKKQTKEKVTHKNAN